MDAKGKVAYRHINGQPVETHRFTVNGRDIAAELMDPLVAKTGDSGAPATPTPGCTVTVRSPVLLMIPLMKSVRVVCGVLAFLTCAGFVQAGEEAIELKKPWVRVRP